jgi:hypothetical protein
VDLDNTIVSFDRIFHAVACREGLADPHVPADKSRVRDHVRTHAGEPQWIRLQGLVYGAFMDEAEPFPGVQEALARCRESGLRVRVISHRTRWPVMGEAHDLHAAARRWLHQRGFHDAEVGLRPEDVFLETTREGKLACIGRLGCLAFVDDLPEVLAEPAFPVGVRRLLFDPAGVHEAPPGVQRVGSWHEAADLLTRP